MPPSFCLRLTPRAAIIPALLPILAAWLEQGEVDLLDAAFLFNPYTLAAWLAGQGANPQPRLQRLRIRRAFTCYQVETLITGTAAASAPWVVLGPLMPFLDEAVRLPERRRLLAACLAGLKQREKVLVFEYQLAAPPPLLQMLRRAAGEVLESDENILPVQMRLF